MKKLLLSVWLALLVVNTAHAEIITKKDYQRGIEKFSYRSASYNEQFTINSVFHGKYIAWVDQNKVRTTSNNPYIFLEIFLKPTGNGKPEEIQLTSTNFVYQIVGDRTPKHGAFSEQYDGYGTTRGTGRYSIYGDNESGYEILQHYTSGYQGPIFRIEYPPINQYRKSKELSLFVNDLFDCIKTGKEMIIKIPYANNKNDIKEQKYITFGISKETMAEWKEASGF